MIITSIELFELLKPKIGDTEARQLVQYIEVKSEESIEKKKDLFLTKEDKTDMIKWMFIFWVGQIGVLIAILTIFFK